MQPDLDAVFLQVPSRACQPRRGLFEQIRRLVQAQVDVRHLVVDRPGDRALERQLLVDVDANAVFHEEIFFFPRRRGALTAIKASASSVAESGRVTKIRPLPCEMVSDWRSAVSNSGPSTRPSTIGAAGQS